MSRGSFHVGTSGWSYNHWRGLFYPADVPPHEWFTHYSAYFHTVEINYSFYRLPAEKTFLRWRERGPAQFVYALKAPRSITHFRKLRRTEEALDRFLQRARLLGSKLGPILYQLPPNLHLDEERLADFVNLLPSDLHHVIEFRHQSWHCDEIFELLREKQVAFCHISLPDFPCPFPITGPIVYVRMHGVGVKYSGSYDEQQLRDLAMRVDQLLEQGLDAYIYFNNDAYAYAVENAWQLGQLLKDLVRRSDAQRSYAVHETG